VMLRNFTILLFTRYYLCHVIKECEIGCVCRYRRDMKCIQNFGQKIRRPLGRPRFRWEDNIKMDLTETGLDWICEILG
jgi:hypothetical protein